MIERFGGQPDTSYDWHVDRAAGALLGGAVADALGWPSEYLRTREQAIRLLGTGDISDFHEWSKRTGGRFQAYIDRIRPGDYSDDTQLTLCVARCIQPDGTFDADLFAKVELKHWLDYARGGGGTMTRAARAISRRAATWDNNFFSYESRGRKSDYTNAGANGAAMRIAPHVLANAYDELVALSGIWRDTIVTHGHPRALWGALIYGKSLFELYNWKSGNVDTFFETLQQFAHQADLHEINGVMGPWSTRWMNTTGHSYFDAFEETRLEVVEFLSTVESSRDRPLTDIYQVLGCFESATRGSGTATVAAALATFSRYGGDYEKAVLRAVNCLGSDTDTIAAMVGSMIGVRKGQGAIPDRWVNLMQDYGYFARAAEAMTRISLRESPANDLLGNNRRYEAEREDRDILFLTRERAAHQGQRVMHPIFGLGWVEDAQLQPIRNKRGGAMSLVRVPFDVGQSCVFHAYQH